MTPLRLWLQRPPLPMHVVMFSLAYLVLWVVAVLALAEYRNGPLV